MIQVVTTVVLSYAAVIGLLFLFQRRLIYVPDRTRPDPARHGVADMTPVTLTTEDGLELLAWWRPPADAEAPVMTYFHGNAGHLGFRGEKVRPYLDDGWGVLLPAWRGYSGNPGRPTEQGLYADGRAALAFVAAQGVTGDRLVLYGESLGSGVAVEMALHQEHRAVALEAPFSSIADVAARMFPFAPVRMLVRDRFDSVAKIARISTPVLVVHGERDTTIPVALGRRLFDAASPPKSAYFVPRAGHNDLYDHGVARRVIDFVRGHPDPE